MINLFNFDEIHDRENTNCLKWDAFKNRYKVQYQLEDVSNLLPMWVADMDFAIPNIIIDGIKERLNHPIFGYSYVGDGCKNAIRGWFSRRFNWEIDANSLMFHQGVVPALATIIETFTAPGDKVCVSTPVYPYFFNIPELQKREAVKSQLVVNEDGSLKYDFTDLEEKFKTGVKMYILCNPHNPGGTVWTKADLEQLVELCIKYDVMLISDEIHADIVFEGHTHIPTLTVKNVEKVKVISCIAPTKTFNIAGIHAAIMVVPDKELRAKLNKDKQAHGREDLNILATAAVEAAYSKGDEWVDEMISYVSKNMDYVVEQLNQIDGIKVTKPHATYLIWIDYSGTGLSENEIMQRLLVKGKLALDPGTKFDKTGNGYLRMNVACPFETVKDGVERFKKALL